jgi:hypothetical protein
MKLDEAAKNFTKALIDLIQAITQKTEAVTPEVVEDTAAPAWPKSFSAFYKGLPESDKATATGQILKDSSCTCWTPKKITLLVMPNTTSGANGVSESDIEDVKGLLSGELGFDGEISLSVANANAVPAEKKAGRPKKVENVVGDYQITAEELKKECVALAKKLNNKTVVIELLKTFGGTKIDEIDKAKYPALLNAVKNYKETTTSDGSDEF